MINSFIKWGKGKNVLIFLHYFAGNASCWKWVAEKIPKEFTCIAINLPGFGNTPLPFRPSILNYALFTKSIIDDLNVKKYSIVGHSMGGKIALQLAAIDNRRVKNIVLLAPSPPGMEAISADIKIKLSKIPTVQQAEKLINDLTYFPLSKIKLKTAIDAQLEIVESARNWWVYIGSKQSIINQLYKIKSPITVLCSKSDPAIPFMVIKNKVMPLFKMSKLIEIKNTGHLYSLEKEGCVAACIAKECR